MDQFNNSKLCYIVSITIHTYRNVNTYNIANERTIYLLIVGINSSPRQFDKLNWENGEIWRIKLEKMKKFNRQMKLRKFDK